MNLKSCSDAEHLHNIFATFRHFREEGLLCDVVLEATTSQNIVQQIPAHRTILEAESQYFNSLFSPKDVSENAWNCSVFINDVEADIVQAVVDYAYSAEFTLPEEQVIPLLFAADKFGMISLRQKCCTFLLNRLEPHNCLELLANAHKINCLDLCRACLDCAVDNFEIVTLLDEFLLLHPTDLKEIISSDNIRVPREELVYDAVLKWVSYDYVREEHFPELMSHVRLPFVSSLEFLNEVVQQEPLVQSKEQCLEYVEEAYTYKTSRKKCDLHKFSQRFKPRKMRGIYDRFITIGGKFNKDQINCIEQYDPAIDTWTTLEEREDSIIKVCACYHDGYMYTIGGFMLNDIKYSSGMNRYNIRDQNWESMMPMKIPRGSHSAAILYGLIYVTGGHFERGYLSSTECYNPESNSWKELTDMNYARAEHGMTDVNGYLLVMGGYRRFEIFNEAELYQPSQDTWMSVCSMSVPRCGLGVASLGGFVYVIGGDDGGTKLNIMESYDVDKDQWSNCTPLNIPRSHMGFVKYGDSLYACGGFDSDGGILQSTEKFNPHSNSWEICASMNAAKANFGIIST